MTLYSNFDNRKTTKLDDWLWRFYKYNNFWNFCRKIRHFSKNQHFCP